MLNNTKKYPIIVIGAGASSLLFASNPNFKKLGKKYLILEHQNQPGKKLLITGGGASNLTHAGSIKDFLDNYYENGKKIRSLLYKYNNLSFVKHLKSLGIETYENKEGKIFPVSMKSKDVLDKLLDQSERNGFSIKNNVHISHIKKNSSGNFFIKTDRENFVTKNLVIAVGGKSFSHTGSDGSLNHIIKKLFSLDCLEQIPALCPLIPKDYPYKELRGVSLENIKIEIENIDRTSHKLQGDLLFTEKGFSGPGILNISRYYSKGSELKISYLDIENKKLWKNELLKRVEKDKKNPLNSLYSLLPLPKRLIEAIYIRNEENISKTLDTIYKDEFLLVTPPSFKNAMVTRGGIPLEKLDLKSMEAKESKGLYAIGEIVDIDGKTGGYNLQFAYSSAICVSENILSSLI